MSSASLIYLDKDMDETNTFSKLVNPFWSQHCCFV